ncbi:Pre-mRNA polyadenylation factor FIP1 [Candida viswanathii]|uniref:Pre-mRNA polyadenylation factor FIP1 n=1 Tax=Candida viswanathii TaxID=5486 RepID=A0A367YG26_9ASCO|nr:Pre-mRNA polyadenylation factor FIP1 [Candida viswanathii]
MANSDDEDAFLYGSDNEDEKVQQPVTKKVKFADEVEVSDKQPTPEGNNEEEEEEADLEEEEESDSDDDIDIIIGDSQPTPSKPTSTSATVPSDTLSELNDTKSGDTKKPKQRTTVTSSTIDVDKVPEYQDKPLTQLDIELLKTKPWRAPGVDVSDYFNFGFDEFTWIYYCHKQDKVRGEFNPAKVMESIMKGTGEGGDGKVVPGAPGGAPGGGVPPFMAGMPPPPPGFMANMPMPPMGMPLPPPGFNGQFPQPYNMPPNPNQK